MARAAALLSRPPSAGPAAAALVGDATLPRPPASPGGSAGPVRLDALGESVTVHAVGTAALNAFDTALADALACLAEAHCRLDGLAADSADGRLAAAGGAVAAALGAVRAVAAHDLVARPFGAVVVLAGCDGLLSVLLDRLTTLNLAGGPLGASALVAERFGLDPGEVG